MPQRSSGLSGRREKQRPLAVCTARTVVPRGKSNRPAASKQRVIALHRHELSVLLSLRERNSLSRSERIHSIDSCPASHLTRRRTGSLSLLGNAVTVTAFAAMSPGFCRHWREPDRSCPNSLTRRQAREQSANAGTTGFDPPPTDPGVDRPVGPRVTAEENGSGQGENHELDGNHDLG